MTPAIRSHPSLSPDLYAAPEAETLVRGDSPIWHVEVADLALGDVTLCGRTLRSAQVRMVARDPLLVRWMCCFCRHRLARGL